MNEEILKKILEVLERIEKKLDENRGFFEEGSVITNPKVLSVYQDYEKRDLVNFLMRQGLPKRMPDECPKCYEKGKKVKGVMDGDTEFSNSIVYHYHCPVCGYKWIAQIRIKPR